MWGLWFARAAGAWLAAGLGERRPSRVPAVSWAFVCWA